MQSTFLMIGKGEIGKMEWDWKNGGRVNGNITWEKTKANSSYLMLLLHQNSHSS